MISNNHNSRPLTKLPLRQVVKNRTGAGVAPDRFATPADRPGGLEVNPPICSGPWTATTEEAPKMLNDHGSSSLVVVPTYNESENLTVLVERVIEHEEGFDILVIDDNSPDRTGELADRLAKKFPRRVSVLHRATKGGLGSAITTGLRHALQGDYKYVFHMDADLSHDPSVLPAMRRALDRADIVVGSRYMAGAGAVRRARHRQLLSRLASLYAGAMLRIPLSDLTGGYRGYRRHVLEVLDLDKIMSRGYAVQIELNHRCNQAGFRFEELAITFRERAWGRSKMSLGIVFEALLVVAALRLRPDRGDDGGGSTAPRSRAGGRDLLQRIEPASRERRA